MRSTHLGLAVFLAAALLAPPALAKTVNVTDVATLTAAINAAAAGDEIVLAAGTYKFTQSPNCGAAGTPAAPIVIRSASPLAAKIEFEWKTVGAHRDVSDKKFDQAILHTDNETPYVFLINVIDAIYQPHRPFNIAGKAEQVPAFNVTFAVN